MVVALGFAFNCTALGCCLGLFDCAAMDVEAKGTGRRSLCMWLEELRQQETGHRLVRQVQTTRQLFCKTLQCGHVGSPLMYRGGDSDDLLRRCHFGQGGRLALWLRVIPQKFFVCALTPVGCTASSFALGSLAALLPLCLLGRCHFGLFWRGVGQLGLLQLLLRFWCCFPW